MPARASATHEASAPVKISSRSHWVDHQWHLDGMRPGLRGYLLRIDWSFDLPDGSRFTDPQWAAWLEDTRRFLWSMRVDPRSADRMPVTAHWSLVSASFASSSDG